MSRLNSTTNRSGWVRGYRTHDNDRLQMHIEQVRIDLQRRTQAVRDLLVPIMGSDAYNAWIDTLPDDIRIDEIEIRAAALRETLDAGCSCTPLSDACDCCKLINAGAEIPF